WRTIRAAAPWRCAPLPAPCTRSGTTWEGASWPSTWWCGTRPRATRPRSGWRPLQPEALHLHPERAVLDLLVDPPDVLADHPQADQLHAAQEEDGDDRGGEPGRECVPDG